MRDRTPTPDPRPEATGRRAAADAELRPRGANRFAAPARLFLAPPPASGAVAPPPLQRAVAEAPERRRGGRSDLLARATIHRRGRAAEKLPARAPTTPGSGRPLPPGLRQGMEGYFGADLARVRVHEGAEATALGALAYTRGDHIHFAPGRFSATSLEGRRLVAHELTHVLQQRAGEVAAPRHGLPINDHPAHEQDADLTGVEAVRFADRLADWTLTGIRRSQPVAISPPATNHARPARTGISGGSPGRPPSSGSAAVQRQPNERTRLLSTPQRGYGTTSSTPYRPPTRQEIEEEEERRRLRRREGDRRRLGSLFDVGKHGEEKLPNQVSEPEFSDLANLYSDIREDKTSLRLARPDSGTDPWGNFEGAAMGDLAKILQTPSGRQLVGTLATGEKTTSIHYEPNPEKARKRGKREKDDWFGIDPHDAEVHYSPGEDVEPGESPEFVGSSDTILFHELTHALHGTTATSPFGKLTSKDLGEDHRDIGIKKEEYATVGLGKWANDPITENRYRAQQRLLQKTEEGRQRYDPRKTYRHRKRKSKTNL